MNLKKIGDTSVGESHESGAITVAEFKTRTVVKRGMYVDLEKLLPKKGDKYEEGWWVTQAQLSPNPGGTGTMTITLADSQDAGGGAWDVGTDVAEVEWQKIEKPIQVNPIILKSASDGDKPTFVDEVEAWRNSPQQRRRNYQIPKASLTGEADPNNNGDWAVMNALAKKVAMKIAKGIESYIVFSPVVSRTRILEAMPVTGECGKIQNPPMSTGLAAAWLKVADTAVQQTDGTWRRTEQWQGADDWDEDLYAKG